MPSRIALDRTPPSLTKASRIVHVAQANHTLHSEIADGDRIFRDCRFLNVAVHRAMPSSEAAVLSMMKRPNRGRQSPMPICSPAVATKLRMSLAFSIDGK